MRCKKCNHLQSIHNPICAGADCNCSNFIEKKRGRKKGGKNKMTKTKSEKTVTEEDSKEIIDDNTVEEEDIVTTESQQEQEQDVIPPLVCEFCNTVGVLGVEELEKRTGIAASQFNDLYLEHERTGDHTIEHQLQQPEPQTIAEDEPVSAQDIIDEVTPPEQMKIGEEDFYAKLNNQHKSSDAVNTKSVKRFFTGTGWGIVWFLAMIASITFALYVIYNHDQLYTQCASIAKNLTTCLNQTRINP